MNLQRIASGNVQTDAASQVQRTPLTHSNVASKSSTPKTAAQAPAPAPVDAQPEKPAALNPRLAAYAENINNRLNEAINNKATTPRQKAALEAAKDHFQSMVGRLDQAFLTEGKPKIDMTAGQGMGMIFEHLTNAVSTVLMHGKVDVNG